MNSPNKKPLIALFTYGGGMRGLIPAHFMQKIEETTGLHMAEMVDVFCGPSTGSILNSALNLPHPYEIGKPKFKARHMVRFYEREGHQIFPQDAFRSFRSLFHDLNNRTLRIAQLDALIKYGNYEHANLGRALRALFGRTKLSETISSLIVPVFNIDGNANIDLSKNSNLLHRGGRAVWLKNIKFASADKPVPVPEVSLYDAVMGSTAAPTYFPCHHFLMREGTPPQDKTITAIDGSIFDNPCTSYMGALRRHIPADRELIFITIGTGHWNRSFKKDDWNRYGSIGVVDPKNDMPLISIFFHAPETALKESFLEEMGDRFYSFNKSLIDGPFVEDFPSTSIDDGSPENIRRLKNFFEMMLEENRKKFEEVCNLLVKNYEDRRATSNDPPPPPPKKRTGLGLFIRRPKEES